MTKPMHEITADIRSVVNTYVKKHNLKTVIGSPCLMCSHPNRAAIEEASVRFNELRSLWGSVDMDGKLLGTNLTWSRFVRDLITPKYHYTGADHRALVRHLEKHIGLKLA